MSQVAAPSNDRNTKFTVNNHSRKTVIAIIYVALVIDYMLTTVVVPIVPDYLTKLWIEEHGADNNSVAYSETSIPVGALFGSKSIVQIVFNLIAGPLTNRIGYSSVMSSGFVLLIISTVTFAFSKQYWTMFVARSVQGIGSAFTTTAGLGLIAKMYTDESERGRAIATALGGLALGSLVGPLYGGVLYHYGGLLLPFGILALLTIVDGGVQAIMLRPKIEREDVKGTNVKTLLLDPYVIISSVAIFVSNMTISIMEPTLPLWMIERWDSSSVVQGLVFFPQTLGYLINTQFLGALTYKYGRWKCTILGLIICGIAGISVPFCPNVYYLIVPIGLTGVGVGMVDSTMFPMLGAVVDKRHSSAYGSVYAIGDSAVCVAFGVGPFIAGPFVKFFGFQYTMFFMSGLNLLFAPFLIFLKRLDAIKRTETSSSSSSQDTSDSDSVESSSCKNTSLNGLTFNSESTLDFFLFFGCYEPLNFLFSPPSSETHILGLHLSRMNDLGASYRQSSPITGYMGHKPGDKFLVGQRYFRGHDGTGAFTARSAKSPSRTLLEHAEPTEALTGAASINYQYDSEGNPVVTEGRQTRQTRGSRGSQRNGQTSHSQLSQQAQSQYPQAMNTLNTTMNGPVFQIPVQFVPALDASSASLQIPVHPSMLNVNQNQPPSRSRSVHDLANNTDRLSIHDEDGNGRTGRRTSRTRRSAGSRASRTSRSKRARSEPKTPRDTRRGAANLNIPPDYDALNGAGSGWWSEGQALRNIRRHRERNNIPNTGEPPREAADAVESEVNQGYYGNGTPAPGYTGHMMDLHRLGIGKNFSDTAKESRKLQQSLRDSFNSTFDQPKTQRSQRNQRSQRSNRTPKTSKSQN
ncbi:unnamed protein product [Bursaphelenchus xylophilus]|uniref:(pine wood nematode) hypothetical protein n=1 Tax=Bursaphelenchus xylophilus TaxID=6326 RepID=A0A7I8X0J0_BURXY|nr:unnamed protein product [Bursaphelenchus xylophilus]CAG9129731.1 unnamed protein product [Bursaphelenchus xylophilus]